MTMLYDSCDKPVSLKFESDDPVWSQLTGRIKSFQIDSLTPTVRLALYEYADWTFRPYRPAKLRYKQNGKQRTITIHPTILLKSPVTTPPDRPDEPFYTIFRLIYTLRGRRS